jgi:hypothetical protein
VEIELRQHVFETFKKDTSGNGNVGPAAEQARKDQRAGRFAQFLVGKGRLTLGEIEFILWEARAGKGELFRLFGDWVCQHFPKLDSAQLEALKKIRRVRNLESHEAVPLDVNEVPGLCRGLLDALLAGTAEKALPSR